MRASRRPALYSCDHVAHVHPVSFELACGVGNAYFDRAHWSRWNTKGALGFARQWYNTCRPDCAAGHYTMRRVRLRLFDPAILDYQRFFASISVSGAHGYRAVSATPHPARGCASTAEYNSIRRGFSRARTERIFGTTGRGSNTHRGYRWCTQYPDSGFVIYAEIWYRDNRVVHKMWSDD